MKDIKYQKTETISAMVEPEIFDIVGKLAFDSDKSKSAWVRELIMDEIESHLHGLDDEYWK